MDELLCKSSDTQLIALFSARTKDGAVSFLPPTQQAPPFSGLFLFFNFFIFGHAGSLLLCGLLSSCGERGLLSQHVGSRAQL